MPIRENGLKRPEAEFKEFESRLKFKPRLKYDWFQLKLYTFFQDLSRRSIEPGRFETRLKFIKFGHWINSQGCIIPLR